ncbi:S-layer homology domain-containing protein [Paenibacillus sp. 481]|uniref:S-layer homology domain-containing protein n=1 Tax=Paenibacillus sp. 481 TaxID=2835869 RepID=UPI001E4D3FAD|nr:S-layer homology domain-containing protein [Paenibacillus sp. 481]UHA73513.1 S-layer homology domain-containing protein [Paenibacillus sp. 481]
MVRKQVNKEYKARDSWSRKRMVSLIMSFVLLSGQFAIPPSAAEAAPAATVDGATFFVDSDNWGGGASDSKADGDLDVGLKNQNIEAVDNYKRYPVEFKITNVNKLPTKSAQLLIRALDVDEYNAGASDNGEWDRVYFSSNAADIAFGNPYTPWQTSWNWTNNISKSGIAPKGTGYKREITQGAYLGTLSGQDSKWNTTVMNFKPNEFHRIAKGDNYVGVTIHHYFQDRRSSAPNTNWQMTVDWAQLIIDGGGRVSGEIDKADLKVETDKVTIDTSFIPKVPGNFAMEVNVIEKSIVNGQEVERNLGISQQLFPTAEQGKAENWNNITIEDGSIDPSKEYVVNIILFEDRGNGRKEEAGTNAGEAQHVVTFSTHDPLVADVAKSALRSAPTAFTADDFKAKYFKVNGGAPNGAHLQSVKIVTLPDPAKGHLEHKGLAVTKNQLIPVQELNKLVFVPVAGGFDGTVDFMWNGYNGTKFAVDDAKVTVNSSPEVMDIHKVMKAGDAELPFTNAGDFAPNYVDPGNEQLEKGKIISLPDPLKGKLVLVNSSGVQTDVTAGQEIAAVDLDRLKFIPQPNVAGVVEFEWSGSDGLQYALQSKTVTIVINTPPVVGRIDKSGIPGATIGFTAANFTAVPAYTDVDGDSLQQVKLTVPSDLADKGRLKYTSSVTGAVYLAPSSEVTLSAAELNSLQFETSPSLPEGSVVSIPWYGSDGMHFSEQPGSIHITYSGVPVAESFSVDANEGASSVSIVLRGSDRESVTGITYGINVSPQKGTLTLDPTDQTGATWIFTPNADFTFGQDHFTYTVTDQDGNTSVSAGSITIVLNKALHGWTGNKDQGNTEVVRALPNEPLKMTAVSSITAAGVTATVNGDTVSLTLSNAATWAADGFKKWESSSYVVPATTSGGQHTVTYVAVNGAGAVLQIESADRLADNHFKMAGASLTLTANPAQILGDGKSTTVLSANVVDESGNPVEDVEVIFSAPTATGEFVGTNKAITNAQGIAQTTYKSAQITGVSPQHITLKAVVNDVKLGLTAEQDIAITFMPASIKGLITSGDNSKPVAGASVRVTLDMNGDGVITPGVDFDETVVTDQSGTYSVVVPKGDATYEMTVTQLVNIGGVPTPVSYKQTAKVEEVTGAGNQSFDSEKTVAGNILVKQPNGNTAVLAQELLSKASVYLKKSDGTYVSQSGTPIAFPLQGQGVFNANGIAIGDYQLEVRYEVASGQSVVIGRSPVKVSASGELNISTGLIDPYGTITDAVTNNVIEGAKVTLQYANTPRNTAKGLVPGQGVKLPAINGFAPSNNASPEQLSDPNGLYAYMVYPETDYVLVVTKQGYESYTSPVLSVEYDIVKHDVKLQPLGANGGGTQQPPDNSTNGTDSSDSSGTSDVSDTSGSSGSSSTSDGSDTAGSSSSSSSGSSSTIDSTKLGIQVTIDSSKVKEGEKSQLTVDYKNQTSSSISSGEVRLTLPAGVVVVDAAGGVVTGNTIVWKVTNVASGQGGNYKPIIQWPFMNTADTVLDITGELAVNGANSKAAVKVNVFSQRFGELKHYRYILGFPDKEFKPNGHLTRAELAAIVARLTENGTITYELPYTDIRSGHWATNYIKIATKHGYFSGYNNATFRPDAPVTRGELAAVMTRFLKLEVNRPVSMHFTDTTGHWAGNMIEALYNGKLLRGYTDGTFKPSKRITRVEAVTMINSMLYRGPLQGLAPLFPDMPTSHWGFGDVQEATVSHESVRNDNSSEKWLKSLPDQVQ